MKTLLTLVCLAVGLGCQAETAITQPQEIHLDQVPASTRVILEGLLPKVIIKVSSLREVARYFERESKRLDPNHIGVKVIGLGPSDFGIPGKNPVYVVSYTARDISFVQALVNTVTPFHAKVVIRQSIYIVPIDADFDAWEKQQQNTPARTKQG